MATVGYSYIDWHLSSLLQKKAKIISVIFECCAQCPNCRNRKTKRIRKIVHFFVCRYNYAHSLRDEEVIVKVVVTTVRTKIIKIYRQSFMNGKRMLVYLSIFRNLFLQLKNWSINRWLMPKLNCLIRSSRCSHKQPEKK